jgi:hypothetical protein
MNNQRAHNKMADVFYADGRIRVEFIGLIGDLFHLWATSGPTPEADGAVGM